MSDEDRSLPATERRRQQARSDGQVALSREVAGAAGLASATLLLMMAGPSLIETLAGRLKAMLTMSSQTPDAALAAAASAFLTVTLPIAATIAAAATLATMLQTGWLFNTKALVPNLGRLNPAAGLKRVFSKNNAVEALKSAVKIGVLGWAVWHVLSRTLQTVAQSLNLTLPAMVDRLARELSNVLLVVLGFQIVIALLDFGWVRFQFAQTLRMSVQEVKQEHKEQEGDPRLKAKIKQIRMARARRRMLAAVPTATVVVTNPTHFAVALSYRRGSKAAPKIVAKGIDDVAARIRETAQAHRVPLYPNPPLARALHALPLDAEVPPEHFKAVAEIIAWIWRVRQSAKPVA